MGTVTQAMALAEKKLSDFFWNFAKGKLRDDEPLYGFALYADQKGEHEICVAEHDDPLICVELVISKLDQQRVQ